MPAIETCLPRAPAAHRDGFDGPPPKLRGPEDSGGDFDSVMRSKLARHSSKGSAHNSSRGGPNSPPIGKKSPPNQATVAADQPDGSDKESPAAGNDETKPATPKSDASTELNSAIAADSRSPLPAFLPLLRMPDFGNELAAKTTDTGKNPAEAAGAISAGAPGIEIPPAGQPKREGQSDEALFPTDSRSADSLERVLLPPEKGFATAAAGTPEESAPEPTNVTGGTSLVLSEPPVFHSDQAESPGPNSDAAAKTEDHPVSAASPQNHRPSAENTGTGVALDDSPMKNSHKAIKVAGPDAKVLPVMDTAEPREKNLPPPLPAASARAADGSGSNLNFNIFNGNQHAPDAEKVAAVNGVDLPSLGDLRLRAVERTHDMMALHGMRLVESKSDSLSVVIKPAVGMELSLELRHRGSGVEAQAVLTRGDRELFAQHWPELQQRLEQRGIKLAALETGLDFSADHRGDFHRPQLSPEDLAQEASAFAEFAAIESPGGASARLAVHEGWESWA